MTNPFDEISRLFLAVEATAEDGSPLGIGEAVSRAAETVLSADAVSRKLMFVGNGASASIASHMSADFLKNGRMRALTFSDPALLTCLGNDLGIERIFAEPIERLAEEGDVLFAISSSGRSPNMIAAADSALASGCAVVTLTGLSPDNPLRRMGLLNFYVPSAEYGPVEVVHGGICHRILDLVLESRR